MVCDATAQRDAKVGSLIDSTVTLGSVDDRRRRVEDEGLPLRVRADAELRQPRRAPHALDLELPALGELELDGGVRLPLRDEHARREAVGEALGQRVLRAAAILRGGAGDPAGHGSLVGVLAALLGCLGVYRDSGSARHRRRELELARDRNALTR